VRCWSEWAGMNRMWLGDCVAVHGYGGHRGSFGDDDAGCYTTRHVKQMFTLTPHVAVAGRAGGSHYKLLQETTCVVHAAGLCDKRSVASRS